LAPNDTGLRHRVEDFLYREAALLDAWQLDDWVALFTEDARYVVPTTDAPEAEPPRDNMFIDDDIIRLRGRVTRLKSRHAHREFPSSRTRHMITNVRVLETTETEVRVEAAFIVYRFRSGESAPFVGTYKYVLVPDAHEFKIRYRRAVLDLEALDDHGAISIIL
jgi:p-cumate 2,3-dioxygenase subunit beta